MLLTGKRQFRLYYVKKGQVLNFVSFIIIQNYLDRSACRFLHISDGIYFVSDNYKCIISPYVVSGLHASLQDFFSCLQLLPIEPASFAFPKEVDKGQEIGGACGTDWEEKKTVQCFIANELNIVWRKCL